MIGPEHIASPLETLCTDCHGEGDQPRQVGRTGLIIRITCRKCNGAGHVPTAQGRQILDLIRHNLEVADDDNGLVFRVNLRN